MHKSFETGFDIGNGGGRPIGERNRIQDIQVRHTEAAARRAAAVSEPSRRDRRSCRGFAGYNGCFIAANWIDRCTYGFNLQIATLAITIAANAVTGDTGPTTPATITGITWSSLVATATTQNPHNLPDSDSELVLATNDPAWTPGGTGNEIVTCTKLDATRFTYAPRPILGHW